MFDGGIAVSFTKLNYASLPVGNVFKKRNQHRARPNFCAAVLLSSVLVHNNEDRSNSPEPKKSSGSGAVLKRCHTSTSMLNQANNTVGIIGGVSAFSTLVFLEKLVWWSTRNGQDCIPFLVSSDPSLSTALRSHASFCSFKAGSAPTELSVIENLKAKRKILEHSGACCLVMPCHLSHAWHDDISEGCLLPFFHVGRCVAGELKAAQLKPPEAGSNVRIGVLATDAVLRAGFYQEELQRQGFEVVLPDKATIANILIPAVEAMNRKDMEGARILLRIAIQLLLVRAVKVILACDEIQCLLPHDDPLLKKCINPMDALARSTIRWAKSTGPVHKTP